MSVEIYPVRFGINRCYVIRDEGAIMIDGGPPNKSAAFQKFIAATPVKPEDIRLMVLTHGDFDHVGSAGAISALTGARIAIHKLDRLNFERPIFNFPPGVTSWGRFSRALLYPLTKIIFQFPAAKADIILGAEDYSLHDFGIAGKIVYTPGHTPGSVSVLLETGDAFVGCLAHNNPPFRLKPGLPIFAEDIEKVKESWRSLISRGVKTIYPAHGDPFPVEVITKALNFSS